MFIIFLINIYFFLSLYIEKFKKPDIEPWAEGGGFLTHPSPFFKHPYQAKNFLKMPKVYHVKFSKGRRKGQIVRLGPRPADKTAQGFMDRLQ